MEPITRVMLRVLNSEQFNPFDMLELTVPGSSDTLYITNAGEQITFGDNDYLPFNFSTSQITKQVSTDSGDQQKLTVTFSNVDGQLGTIASRLELIGIKARLLRHDRSLILKYPDRTRDAMELIVGEIRNPVIGESVLSFDILGILGIMEDITVPRRIFQPKCNLRYGSTACGVDVTASPNRIEITVLSGSRPDYIRFSDSILDEVGRPHDPTEYWLDGSVVMKDGLAAGQGRAIQRVIAGGGQRRFYVKSPFLVAPAPGDTAIVLRGCPHTKSGCLERQGNVLRYGGFEELPPEQVPVITPILWHR